MESVTVLVRDQNGNTLGKLELEDLTGERVEWAPRVEVSRDYVLVTLNVEPVEVDEDERADARAALEYLRGELRAERISQGELIQLQGLAEFIEPGDVELLEAAGVPEFPDEDS